MKKRTIIIYGIILLIYIPIICWVPTLFLDKANGLTFVEIIKSTGMILRFLGALIIFIILIHFYTRAFVAYLIELFE